MKAAAELYNFLKKMSAPGASCFPAIVKEINSDDTIDVDVDGLIYHEVQVKAAVLQNQKGITPKPALESVVLVQRIGDEKSNELAVIMYSSIDEWSIEIDSVKYLMDKDGFTVEKGGDSLKEILNLIIEAVQKIVVMQGTNPDYVKLIDASTKTNNLFK